MGVKKNPADRTTVQMNSASLYFTFKTERGKDIPRINKNPSKKIGIKRIIVLGGIKPNITINIPRTTNSVISKIDAVIVELMAGKDRGK
jgi:hypothetical protein